MIYFQPGPAYLFEVAALHLLEEWLSAGKEVIFHADDDYYKNSELQNLKDKYPRQIFFYIYHKKHNISRYFLISNQVKKIIKTHNIKQSYLHNFVYFENRMFIYFYHNKPGDKEIFIFSCLKQDKDLSGDFKLRAADYIYKNRKIHFWRRIWRIFVLRLTEFISEHLMPFIYTYRSLPSDINLCTGELRPFRGDKYNLQFICYSGWDEAVFQSRGITKVVRADHPARRRYIINSQVKDIDVTFFFTRGMVQHFMSKGYTSNESIKKYFIKEVQLLNDICPGLKIGVRLHPNEFYTDQIVKTIQQYFEGIEILNDKSHNTFDAMLVSKVIISDGSSVGYLAGLLKKQLVISINHLKLPNFAESSHYDGVVYSDSIEKTCELYQQIPKVLTHNNNSKTEK